MKTSPRIKEVSLSLDLPNTLNLSITERNPHSLWCDYETPIGCFFVDEEGFIFEKALNFSNDTFFRYYIDLSELKPSDDFIPRKPNTPIRQFVLENEYFKEIDSFVKFIDGLGLEPYKFVGVGQKFEIYFGPRNSKIIFNKEQSIKEVMGNFQSVLNLDDFADVESLKKLEYVDLRFGNKVFYK